MKGTRFPTGPCCGRRGFSLVEAALSMLVVSVMLAAALNTLGAAQSARRTADHRLRGLLLAEQMLAEILTLPYTEPNGAISTLGPEAGESLGGTRALFDDVDDYAGWNESPPRDRDGAELEGYQGWSRKVSVVRVNPQAPDNVVTVESGVKRITVEVFQGVRPIARLSALRTEAMDRFQRW